MWCSWCGKSRQSFTPILNSKADWINTSYSLDNQNKPPFTVDAETIEVFKSLMSEKKWEVSNLLTQQ